MLTTPPTFHCTVWDDNQSCISKATSHKFTPRTQHIALKYHHFREWVESKKIAIQYVHTDDQQADILTKPVKTEFFFPFGRCSWVVLHTVLDFFFAFGSCLATRECADIPGPSGITDTIWSRDPGRAPLRGFWRRHWESVEAVEEKVVP